MLRDFRADLHVHTCLSPCASNEMSPQAIVAEAVRKNLNPIGICDHNATENVEAVRRAAEKAVLAVVGGVEIASREEVHILGLFDENSALRDMTALISRHLHTANDEAASGEQLVVDEHDNIIGTNPRLLIGATELCVDHIVDAIHELGGLAIASHIDRQAFGIIGQLGLIPPGLRLDALELSPAAIDGRERIYRDYNVPLVTSSDAHYLEDLGRSCTTFTIERVSVGEMRKALQAQDGRKVRIG